MSKPEKKRVFPESDPQWYKDAVIYELHVRAFYDSNEDGIGDFQGLAQKLDYLKDLGITAIWILPFFPSPLKDDGYDTADYTDVHPAYGNMRDFKRFLKAAHERGLRVITELVLNHTSDQHAWFQKARQAKPGSKKRDFYVWSETAEEYKEARIIFQDFESSNWTWDPVAKAYFWHRFYSNQPDLNYDNPTVKKAMFKVLDFWFDLGVDGVRLDAVPYLYEREGTNCENLPETFDYLRELRTHLDSKFEDRMLLAEANQWPEDSVRYFGDDDMCHMAFHFPIMPRLFMSLHMEDRWPLIDILDQTPDIPENSQWAVFLRNHDELTLEMVTDEERDFMYRVYAHDPRMRINLGIRRRLAPLMGNNRRRIELLNGLLFSLPGTPVLYYGDEIGMGDNIYLGDRNGVRTPMQWSADRNAGFSKANPQRLFLPVIIDPEYHYETVNVEAQRNNPHSLLWWMKRIMALRKRHKAFGRGTIEFLAPENRKVLAFVRKYKDESILIVANLSRFSQYAELDLSDYAGWTPVELFGRVDFPQVTDAPYFLSLGPHSFYWFEMTPHPETVEPLDIKTAADKLPLLTPREEWSEVLRGEDLHALEKILPAYLKRRNWFSGKSRKVTAAELTEALAVTNLESTAYIAIIKVTYGDGEEETYSLPLAFATDEKAQKILQEQPQACLARIRPDKGVEGILFDALLDFDFCRAILETVPRRANDGARLARSGKTAFHRLAQDMGKAAHEPTIREEQSNTVIVFGDKYVLKFFRRIEGDVNPELEIGRYLTEVKFPFAPKTAGALEYRRGMKKPMTLAILQNYVPNQGTAWEYAVDTLGKLYEQILATREMPSDVLLPMAHMVDAAEESPPAEALEFLGEYMAKARLLGRRIAELHYVLAHPPIDMSYQGISSMDSFTPVLFSKLYQRSLHQSFRSRAGSVLQHLKRMGKKLPEETLILSKHILEHEKEVKDFSKALPAKLFSGSKIRCHGHLHLGQVLMQDNDFVILDFEGNPARPYGERRIKRSPLRDVTAVVHSYHFAAYHTLTQLKARGMCGEDDLELLTAWAEVYRFWSGTAFVKGYLNTISDAGILPDNTEDLRTMFDVFLMGKCIREMERSLMECPEETHIPLIGMRRILEVSEALRDDASAQPAAGTKKKD